MAVGIDPGCTLQFVYEDEVKVCHGATGIPPSRKQDKDFIWSTKRVFRQTTHSDVASFEKVWLNLFHPDKPAFSWKNNGIEQSRDWDLMASDALNQIIPQQGGKIALAIDNSLSEDQQDKLLSVCTRARLSNVDLLWRPIAIALDFLRSKRNPGLVAGQKLIVIDSESSVPEITILDLRIQQGVVVPLRKAGHEGDKTLSSLWRSFAATKVLADALSETNTISKALTEGEFSADFSKYRDEGKVETSWVRCGARYESLTFNPNRHELIDRIEIAGSTRHNLINEGMAFAEEIGADAVLWHGWPFRGIEGIENKTNFVMDSASVCRGSFIYGECIDQGRPTYLEDVPELSIMSEVQGTNRYDYFVIIPSDEYPGGKVITVRPIDRFSIKQGISKLPIILKRADWESPRKVVFDGIPPLNQDSPIIISGQMKPGQGKVKLWIEAKDLELDLFGERKRIEINWDTMEDFEMTPYCGPEVSPVQGRVFDSDDPDARRVLKDVIDAGGPLTRQVDYHGHNVRFSKVMQPWGYRTPWGAQLREPTRGLFGSKNIDDVEIDRLADQLSNIITASNAGNTNARHKFLNYMFKHAPDSFVAELKEIYSAPDPSIPGWNTAFAPGRVFQTAEDLTIFFNFIVNQSSNTGWPEIPDISYTAKYYWSVFRSLSYYDDPANVDSNLASGVCHSICNYLDFRNANRWAAITGESGRWMGVNIQTAQKSCLCALLFLTRVRKSSTQFMEYPCDHGGLAKRIITTVEAMPTVPFPAAMLTVAPAGSMDEFTLKFIKKEVDTEDYVVLEGLITSMN
ncbi:MAG: hypothetical protein J7K85_04840 [Anaerolineaceae bacterium]|nr:hypothetical protein [Anaerolineaceae bacterium]